MPVLTELEPTEQDIDDIVRDLEQSWTATSRCGGSRRKTSAIATSIVSLDGESLGILQHGDVITRETYARDRTGCRRTIRYSGKRSSSRWRVDEHASFIAINRAGFGTYSVLAFFIGFLGAGPFYLTFERETPGSAWILNWRSC